MRLSVIIPYYNADAWIGAMLDSLLDQDLPKEDYEILVVDDGSTESTLTLDRYVAAHANIRCHRQENRGPAEARNAGLDQIKSDWVFFCDSDDFVQTQVLGRMLDMAEEHQLEVLVGKIREVRPGEPIPEPRRHFDELSPLWNGWDYIATHLVPSAISMSQFLIRRDFIEQHHFRYRNYFYSEDRHFHLDLLQVVQRLMEINVDLYYYVQRESSIMHQQRRLYYNEKYAPSMLDYLTRVSDILTRPDLRSDVRPVLRRWQDACAFLMILNHFRYSPFQCTPACLDQLAAIGAYPVQVRGSFGLAFVRRCMNWRWGWIFACRIFHLLPACVRRRF